MPTDLTPGYTLAETSSRTLKARVSELILVQKGMAMSDQLVSLHKALQDQKSAIALEQERYQLLVARWSEYQAGKRGKPSTELFQDWKAAMQNRLDLSSLCVLLVRP